MNKPIIHRDLPEDLLERIENVYNVFRGMLPICREQFEVCFMRDENPEAEASKWEMYAETFQDSMAIMRKQKKIISEKNIYDLLMKLILQKLTPEENLLDEVRILQSSYTRAYGMFKGKTV